MLDFSNEIFSAVAENLRSAYKGITVKGEYDPNPAKFPCVTIDEISNVPAHMDSALKNKYANVVYRVQIFSNKSAGKRAEARAIYSTVDDTLMELGLYANTYTSTPTIYNAEIYSITATFEGIIGADGTVYRN